jgi:AcrR family transcriptional regulator
MPRNSPRTDSELKIGDLERRTGVSRSSIQHYVRTGLLPPPRKIGPKLFLFDARHVELLMRVRALREAERLTLPEIRQRLRVPASWNAPFTLVTEAPLPPDKTSSSASSRRVEIIEVATQLFARHGFQGVRLADVAREMGLSKAALYVWFESKEMLFVECIDHIRLLVIPEALRETAKREPDPMRRAHNRASAVLKHFASYRMLTHLLVSVANGRDEQLAEKARVAFHRMVTDVVPELRQALADGMYREADLELDAYMLWGALMGAGDFMTMVRRDPIASVSQAYVDMMADGTRTRPTPIKPAGGSAKKLRRAGSSRRST